MPEMPTREDILRLSSSDLILHAALGFWHHGLCTFEEAMMIAVVALVEQNRLTLNQNIELVRMSVAPPARE